MFQFPGLYEISGSSDGPNFLGQIYYVDYVDTEEKDVRDAGVDQRDRVLCRQPGPLPEDSKHKPLVWDNTLSVSRRWRIILAVCLSWTNQFVLGVGSRNKAVVCLMPSYFKK